MHAIIPNWASCSSSSNTGLNQCYSRHVLLVQLNNRMWNCITIFSPCISNHSLFQYKFQKRKRLNSRRGRNGYNGQNWPKRLRGPMWNYYTCGGGAGSGHPSYQRQPEVVELLRPHSHLRLFITSLKHRSEIVLRYICSDESIYVNVETHRTAVDRKRGRETVIFFSLRKKKS